jgi:hypothetical protein
MPREPREQQFAEPQPRPLFPASGVPQPRDVTYPDFTSDTYVPFALSITGNINLTANMGTVWAPMGVRFRLRGGYVMVVCSVTCAGASALGELYFYDNDENHTILPLGWYSANATALGEIVVGTDRFTSTGSRIVGAPWPFDLGRGYRSLTAGNPLKIGGILPIGAGTFYCSGQVWGVQE